MNQYSTAEPIMDYLDRIHSRFLDCLKEGQPLCRMRKLSYTLRKFPSFEDYSDADFQRYYLLRYGYAYAFEYKKIYELLLEPWQAAADCCNLNGQISVTSIGCGAMLDYWALARVLENDCPRMPVSYEGIDLVNWEESCRVRAVKGDHVRFFQEDAIRFLQDKKSLDSHIYFFPKSISEFSTEDFQTLCGLFRDRLLYTHISGCFHVVVSLREHEKSAETDYQRAMELKRAILNNRAGREYELVDERTKSSCKTLDPDSKIWELDGEFPRPSGIIDTVTGLYRFCSEFQSGRSSCGDTENCMEDLSRHPILSGRYAHFVILTFKRKSV